LIDTNAFFDASMPSTDEQRGVLDPPEEAPAAASIHYFPVQATPTANVPAEATTSTIPAAASIQFATVQATSTIPAAASIQLFDADDDDDESYEFGGDQDAVMGGEGQHLKRDHADMSTQEGWFSLSALSRRPSLFRPQTPPGSLFRPPSLPASAPGSPDVSITDMLSDDESI
jgi:hypothetical protein